MYSVQGNRVNAEIVDHVLTSETKSYVTPKSFRMSKASNWGWGSTMHADCCMKSGGFKLCHFFERCSIDVEISLLDNNPIYFISNSEARLDMPRLPIYMAYEWMYGCWTTWMYLNNHTFIHPILKHIIHSSSPSSSYLIWWLKFSREFSLKWLFWNIYRGPLKFDPLHHITR